MARIGDQAPLVALVNSYLSDTFSESLAAYADGKVCQGDAVVGAWSSSEGGVSLEIDGDVVAAIESPTDDDVKLLTVSVSVGLEALDLKTFDDAGVASNFHADLNELLRRYGLWPEVSALLE